MTDTAARASGGVREIALVLRPRVFDGEIIENAPPCVEDEQYCYLVPVPQRVHLSSLGAPGVASSHAPLHQLSALCHLR